MLPTHENFDTNEYTQKSHGWKIHLNVGEKPDEALLRDLIDFCRQEAISYKQGRNSGQEGKGMTLYVGSHDRLVTVAKALQQAFGSRLLPPAGDTAIDNRLVEEKIAARFDARRTSEFSAYGSRGLPYLSDEAGAWNAHIPRETKLRHAVAALSETYGTYFHGTDKSWLHAMQAPAKPTSKEL